MRNIVSEQTFEMAGKKKDLGKQALAHLGDAEQLIRPHWPHHADTLKPIMASVEQECGTGGNSKSQTA